MRAGVERWLQHPWITLICRLILGGTFVFASLSKIIDPEDFAFAIYNYRLIPESLINVVAIAMPWVELSAGLAVILGFGTRGAALILTGLVAIFALSLGISLARGLDIACGCFGSKGGKITVFYLIRDLGLFVIALQVLFYYKGHFSLVSPKTLKKFPADKK